jgi:hypothetical protein
MLELRLYRAAFVPFLLALVIVAFSLGARPRPLSATLAPDAFSGASAIARLNQLTAKFPDRRPGSNGDAALASFIARSFNDAHFPSRTHEFDGDTVAGRQSLSTVIGTRQGSSNSTIAIVAHRDARQTGSAAELSGTAALLELTHIFGGRVTQHSLALVSTSGGSGGAAGAADLARRLPHPVAAVIVLGDVAGTRSRRPYVVPWSDGSQIAPIRLRRTVETALQEELGRSPGGTAATDQLARLAFPMSVGEQGPLLAAGLPAVLVQQSGEVGPGARDGISEARLQSFGRGVLRALNALDSGPSAEPAPTRDVLLGSRVLAAWGVRLLVGLLILPALIGAVDVFARVRRRRQPIAPWFTWVAAGAVPFALAALFAAALGRSGLLHAAPAGPVTAHQLPLGIGARTALVSVALVFALGWMLRTALLRARRGSPGVPGAATALILTSCGLAILVWLANPYAAALLVLPLHIVLLATTLEPRPPRAVAVALLAGSLLPLLLLAGLDAERLGLGPQAFAWMGLLLVAGGHVGLIALLLWSLAAGVLVGALTIVLHRAREEAEREPTITVRGPLTYAGPGSLGGTDSALRR